eukprot:CAMPEP_0197898372 /NCGR_PEP_ID=MMETSP1439-20131203/43868_1 /TAXON_ID=66791 /ORGANISM="Gonyaulax spinifera, Strain CCMP409" /LENGTH=157 /DNA_ID=CAMNT_0043519081 /DNA_START=140 /DNA_END=609 /DNA_ORIENTATION=+
MSSCQGVRESSAPSAGPLQRLKRLSSSSKKPGQEKAPVILDHLSFALLQVGHTGGTPRARLSAARSSSSSLRPVFGRPFFARSAPSSATLFLPNSSRAAAIALSCSSVRTPAGSWQACFSAVSPSAAVAAFRLPPGAQVLLGVPLSPPRQVAKIALT